MKQAVPKMFGRYQIDEQLAVGGMAELYKGRVVGAHGFQKPVVIKRILPHFASNPSFVSMFIDEANLTARLDHPKIAQVLELGLIENQLFIAMEYVDGRDLRALLNQSRAQSSRIPPRIAVHIALELLDALGYAHGLTDEQGNRIGVIHRDISPSNVLLSWRGDVKLADFGIARAMQQPRKTQAGVIKGKYHYLSPEQVSGRENPDGRSDLFAVGIVLAEMLMGRKLFMANNQLDLLVMVRDARIERFEKFGADINPALQAIVQFALRKEPESRFQTAAEFTTVLADWLFTNRLRVGTSELAGYLKEMFEKPANGGVASTPVASGTIQIGLDDCSAVSQFDDDSDDLEDGASLSDAITPGPISTGSRDSSDNLGAATVAEAFTPFLDMGSPKAHLPEAIASPAISQVAKAIAPQPIEAETPFAPRRRPAAAVREPSSRLGPVVELERSGPNEASRRSPVSDLPRKETPFDVARGVSALDSSRKASPIDPPRKASATAGGRTSLPPPNEAGDLSATSPTALLHRLTIDKATALLVMDQHATERSIHLVDGVIAEVESNAANEALAIFLERAGVISDLERSLALAMLPQFRGSLPLALVELGVLERDRVVESLRLHAQNLLLAVLGTRTGRYRLYLGQRNAVPSFSAAIQTTEILRIAARAVPEAFLDAWARTRMASVMVAAPGALEAVYASGLEIEAISLCERLEGRSSTLRTLLEADLLPAERARLRRLVHLLIEIGLVVCA